MLANVNRIPSSLIFTYFAHKKSQKQTKKHLMHTNHTPS